MKFSIILAVILSCGLSTGAMAAQQYLQGEAVFVGKGAKNCIVQTGKPDHDGKYEVKCGKDKTLVAPSSMRSNPDQTKTSRTFVCPAGGKPSYFKP